MANVKTRIIQKHDSSANWAKATTFVPLKGEIIIYDDLGRVKIGDGATKVNDLQFLDKDAVKQVKLNNVAKTPNADGVVDLGTVITAHQDISGKVNTSTTIAGKPLTGNISASALRTALNVEYGANNTMVENYFDANSTHPIENQLITRNFQGVNLDCDLNQLWQLNTECQLQSTQVIDYIHELHHNGLSIGKPCQIYLFDTNYNIYIFDGASQDDTYGYIYLFHASRYENNIVNTYNLTIKENNGMLTLKKANNSLLCFDVDADIFNGAVPSQDNGVALFNWIQTNNLHKTFANFNLTYQQRVGSFFVNSYAQASENTYNEFTLVGGGFGNRNRGLVEIVLVAYPSATPQLRNNYFAYDSDIPNTNSFVKTSGAQTINGTKTFAADTKFTKGLIGNGDSAYIKLDSSIGQDATTLEIYPDGTFGFLFANGDLGDYFKLPSINNPDYDKNDPYILATTYDIRGTYEYRKRTNMTSTSYSTNWTVRSQTTLPAGVKLVMQISSGPYSVSADNMINKSVFIWNIPNNWNSDQTSVSFETETSTSSSGGSLSIDGGVRIIFSVYGGKTDIILKGRNANSTPGKVEFWTYK